VRNTVQSTLPRLRRIVERIANSPNIWFPSVRFDLSERYCRRLRREDDHEVWLICWDLGQDTLLHDHGGSSGAFAVAQGGLIEDFGAIDVPRLRTRRHLAGSAVTFGADYIHNLVNVGVQPTVSIHAYAPPLRRMNFYCWLPTGMHQLRSIACDTPEPVP
jgi:predicted metal-dependent enzyme (double-stranded beta helix superfamily)